MKIALFGGRFDPVHNGHIAVAKEILKLQIADQVWLLPDAAHQWNPIVASSADRVEMLKLAIKNEKNLKVNLTAIDLGGSTETIKVLHALKNKYDHEFVFVGGSDQLPSLHKWTHWEQLEKELPFIIVNRKNYPIQHNFTNVQVINDIDYEPLEDSSTRIRSLLSHHQSIKGLVNPEVEEYIAQKKLYV